MSSKPISKMQRMLGSIKFPMLVNGPDQDALFDPFWFEGEEFFLYWEANMNCWAVGRPLERSKRRALPPINGENDGCSAEELEALNRLKFFPAPRLPETLECPLVRGPFWYRERTFAWVMMDMKSGWNLALYESGNEPAASSDAPLSAVPA